MFSAEPQMASALHILHLEDDPSARAYLTKPLNISRLLALLDERFA